MKIRWKLLVVLLAPVIALSLVVGAEVRDRRVEAREANRAKNLIEVIGLGDQVRRAAQLQVTLVVIPQTPQTSERLREARATTRERVAAFRVALGRLEPADYGSAFVTAVAELDHAIRDYEASSPKDRTTHEVSDVLTDSIGELGFAGATSISQDGELARGALGYTSLLVASEASEHVLHHMAHASDGEPVDSKRITGLTAEASEAALALEVFKTTASTEQRAELNALLNRGVVRRADAVVESAQATEIGKPLGVDWASFAGAMERKVELLQTYADRIGSNVAALASDKDRAASRSATYYVGIGLLAIIVAVGLAAIFLASISRRLRRLVIGANALAKDQLPTMVASLRNPGASESVFETPAAVEHLGRDEIGELGVAFNSVQASFVEVARDQANLLRSGISEIFVKLARRNQSLVERQIELLDELEAAEKDPDILENLFKLDHIATRARRNAESLLVLAGTDPTRKWSDPVPLVDLLQGAMAEIEDYGRVHLANGQSETSGSTARVIGQASVDVAHLLAELLDNAVRFSPPGTPVDVLVRGRGDWHTVYITDVGMGMTDEQLEEANELLANPPEPGLDLSRTLGLYVVARLAARHGVGVRLARSPYDGVVASVSFPPHLVVQVQPADAVPEPATTAVGGGLGNGVTGAPATQDPGVLPTRRVDGVPAGTSAPTGVQANGEGQHVPEALPHRVQPRALQRGLEPDSQRAASERGLGVAPSQRTPDERRRQLTSFLTKLDEGRKAAGPDSDESREEAS
jgi:signal transduction histidine kinase